MQTLKIEIPEGFEIDSFDKVSGQVRFKAKPKKVTERIMTIDDAIISLGKDDADVKAYEILRSLSIPQHIIANQAAVLFTKALNEGWTPDWSNSNEWKYYPWFEMRGSSGFRFGGYVSWYSASFVGSRLAFKNRELAEYAGKQFIDTYKNFMTI